MSKGNRNRTLRKERRADQMNEQNTDMMEMRLKRIREHPLNIKGNYIVVDNLECGVIDIVKHIDEDTPLYLQTIGDITHMAGVTLVGEITISVMEEESIVVVEDLYYKEGYTELRGALIRQVSNFVDFYHKKHLAFDQSVYPEWLAEIGKDE